MILRGYSSYKQENVVGDVLTNNLRNALALFDGTSNRRISVISYHGERYRDSGSVHRVPFVSR